MLLKPFLEATVAASVTVIILSTVTSFTMLALWAAAE